MEIEKDLYDSYFSNLIQGNKALCMATVDDLTARGTSIEVIYTDLFQRSLYQVGEYWEQNKISVATEHLATAMTENLMIRLQPQIFSSQRTGKKIVVACVANEYHQIGAKMIADIFEMNGWDGYFIGAGTPAEELIRFLKSQHPDLIGISLSIYFNLNEMTRTLEKIRKIFPRTTIIVGGQAFKWGGKDVILQFDDVHYIPDIPGLQRFINQ